MHDKVWQEAADRNVQARTFYKFPTISQPIRHSIVVENGQILKSQPLHMLCMPTSPSRAAI